MGQEEVPSQPEIKHPAFTRYRLTIVVLTVSFGLSKAAFAYLGYSTVPTTLEWISGVVIGLSLYWLGLYESDPPPSIAWNFQDVDTGRTYEICVTAHWPVSSIHWNFTFAQFYLMMLSYFCSLFGWHFALHLQPGRLSNYRLHMMVYRTILSD
ncbi:hypothetical protein BD410DRAFT_590598 [Rickenella mellea]|uniref:Uncharacterized protein n=1 Tax=Rickenella mellea TaxID=50990 RepID=A0A4Y7PNW1_9AGAM|nr:hypothetical protein BD410DRAFT_590598 [Rickenella mellea]